MSRSLLFTEEGQFAAREEIANQLLSRNEAARSLVSAIYGLAKLLAAAESGYLRELEPDVEQACQTLSLEGMMVEGEIKRAIPPRRCPVLHYLKKKEEPDGT
jgi:hypothetical protein